MSRAEYDAIIMRQLARGVVKGMKVDEKLGKSCRREERENNLRQQCLKHCYNHGWMVLSSRTDQPTGRPLGEPDLQILLSDGRSFFFELKTDIGKPSPNQQGTLAMLRKLGFSAHLVRSYEQFVRVMDAEIRSYNRNKTAHPGGHSGGTGAL